MDEAILGAKKCNEKEYGVWIIRNFMAIRKSWHILEKNGQSFDQTIDVGRNQNEDMKINILDGKIETKFKISK